jgi:hypothetical protein
MNEFRKEVDQILTKDQITRLKEMDDSRQKMIRQNRRNHENDTLYNHHERRHPEDSGIPREGITPYHDRDTVRLHDNK